MNYIELSAEDAKRETLRLAETIGRDYVPDSIIFIAKGAYQIGLDLGEFFNVPVLEIFAERRAINLKSKLAPLLQVLPPKLKAFLRKKEVQLGIHKKSIERNIHWGTIPTEYADIHFSRILLVDDSCDTGNSFTYCIRKIKMRYPDAEIRTAAINVLSTSFEQIKTDFYLYTDYIISGPWSNDSKEHKEFNRCYLIWHAKIGQKLD